MESHVFFAFVVATAIMIALPGPSVLLTVAHSISFGWRYALFTVAGATVGIGVQLLVAAVGLTSLLTVVSEAFEWLRWVGVVYLVYLGIKQWRSAHETFEFGTQAVSRGNLFVQGLIITIPNPKSLIFIAAFLPQFIDIARSPEHQFAIIIPTFLFITFVVTSAWALLAGEVRGYLQNQRAIQIALRTTGCLMILAGVGLAMARK